jgi:hypothetical protein
MEITLVVLAMQITQKDIVARLNVYQMWLHKGIAIAISFTKWKRQGINPA